MAAFAKVLRQKLAIESWPYQWSSVQIDPANYGTRYVPDIVTQIAKSARLTLPPSTPQVLPAVTIGRDIRAESVDISHVNVALSGDDDLQSLGESGRIDELCAALRNALRTRRVALIFVDTHRAEPRNLVQLSHRLWDGRLSELLDHGLLVVDIFDPDVQLRQSQVWPPEPCLVLDLPDRFDHGSRLHAMQDLVEIALNEGVVRTPEEARVFAQTLLSSFSIVRDVHANLATVITGVRRWQQ